jgi:hypothetical protein
MRNLHNLLVVLSLSVFSSAGFAAYRYKLIDEATSGTAILWGITNAGLIIGSDANTTTFFLYDNTKGVLTPLNPLNSLLVYDGINERGDLVGSDFSQPEAVRCFVQDKAGAITYLSPPSDNGGFCDARGIAPNGDVAGYSVDSDGVSNSFVYNRATGAYTEFAPGAASIANQINAAGAVTGNLILPGFPSSGFVRKADGSFRLFNVSINNTLYPTRSRAISDVGLLAGVFNANGRQTGFIGQLAGDPLSTSLIPTQVIDILECDFGISLQGINNAGVVVGYCDKTDGRHGLIVTLMH